MICLGLWTPAKVERIQRYLAEHPDVTRVIVVSSKRFALPVDAISHEAVDYAEATFYRVFYPLLQKIDGHTLLVLNECMRSQNRYELTYNCLRLYAHQTPHRMIFQYLPLIDQPEDFAVLFDFDTDSQWKREPVTPTLLREATIHVTPVPLELRPHRILVDDKVRAVYAKEKAALLNEVRGDPDKDPHQIPRNLLLVSGKAKLPNVDMARRYVSRNNRFKLANVETYREAVGEGERVVLELPHNFIDLADFLAVSRQHVVDVLVADTKAEEWYLRRFQDWVRRVHDASAALHG